MGLGPGFLGCCTSPPLVPASHFHTMRKIGLHIYMQKLLLAHGGGGGGGDSDFNIFNVKLIVLTKILHL